MSELSAERLLTPEEYLSAERDGEVRHEYIGGLITAMAGASRRHNIITGNLYADINRALRGTPCQSFVSDMKVRLALGRDEIFYYPDILVTCDSRDREHADFVRYPKLIIEVLSPATERLDRREKFFAYLQIPSLEEYVLISQERPEALAFRAADNWTGVQITDTLELRSIGLPVPFADIFVGVEAE
ncbi:MAG: Uma2 family endonuclease [Puniceicoccales bacterium]